MAGYLCLEQTDRELAEYDPKPIRTIFDPRPSFTVMVQTIFADGSDSGV